MYKRSVLALISACLLLATPNMSLAAQQIGWQDLTMPVDPSENPYFDLGTDQMRALEELLFLESYREEGTELPERASLRIQELHEELAAAGLDAQVLIEKEKSFEAKVVAQASMMRPELDGAQIKIPGYVIPLEFDGNQTVEFLLVPYVGACIHTPPPPANQIIHVRSQTGFSTVDLFTPVWVTGELLIEQSQQSVGLSDGVAGFAVGYALKADEIVEYRQ